MKPRVERAEKVFVKINCINVWTRSETASGAIGKFFGKIKLVKKVKPRAERAENFLGRQKLIKVYVSTRSETGS